MLLARVIREGSGGGRQNPKQLTRSEKPWEKASAMGGAPGAEDWGVLELSGWKTKIVCLSAGCIHVKGLLEGSKEILQGQRGDQEGGTLVFFHV